MDFSKQIAEIQDEHCRNCRAGRALIALKGLDEPELVQPEPSQPVTQRNTAKSQQKTAVSKAVTKKLKPAARGKNGDTRHVILEYLARNPGSKKSDIAAGTGLTPMAVAFHLTRAQKQGVVINTGKGRDSRWSMAGKTGPKVDPTPERFDDEEFTCKLCKSPSASKERWERHMLQVHGKVV